MFETVEQFSNGYALLTSGRNKVVQEILKTIKKELPEEAHFLEMIFCILDECKEEIKNRKIIL